MCVCVYSKRVLPTREKRVKFAVVLVLQKAAIHQFVARKLAALSHSHKHGVQRRQLGKEISSRSEQVDPIAAWEDC
jgi:hypothetical protein